MLTVHVRPSSQTFYGFEVTWFDERRSPLRCAAYFSPEFGIAETLPQYSGGLGVLAGDHLKAAADLGVPLVGVGLFYRQGYFHQALDEGGWQHERYYDLDPDAIGLVPAEAEVEVDLAGATVRARAWRLGVARVPLFFLDADGITDRLYGGDTEHRLRQEIVLGIGGVRLLSGLGLQAQVFHSNEGHAGFLALERIRQAVAEHGLSFEDAVTSVRRGGVFTTHTPVPAGIDRFPRPLMERYFGGWAEECGTDLDALMAMGHEPDEAPDAPFNMAVMGLRLAGRANAVSRLHAAVSRRMFASLDVPIDAITNGVHAPTWGPSEVSIADDDKGLWAFRRAG